MHPKVPVPEPWNMIQGSTSLWERAKIEWPDPGPIVASPAELKDIGVDAVQPSFQSNTPIR